MFLTTPLEPMSVVKLSPERPSESERLADITARLRDGDIALHGEVLRELVPSVRRWCARLIGPRADLDDAVQDALTEISRALPRFEGRSSISTLAHRIAVRRAYRFMKASRWVPLEQEHEELEAPFTDPERDAIARQALERLYVLLERLSPPRRLAFVLCVLEGFSPAEAARTSGTTSLVMRARLHHARRAMSEWMRNDDLLGEYTTDSEAL